MRSKNSVRLPLAMELSSALRLLEMLPALQYEVGAGRIGLHFSVAGRDDESGGARIAHATTTRMAMVNFMVFRLNLCYICWCSRC